jgi:tripartite-type tricarboxylate transporter receptor subunit TctC
MKFLLSIILGLFTLALEASEIIKIYSPYSPGHSATPALRKILDEANLSQDKFRFILEFKPGGNQAIAVKTLDKETTSLAVIAPAFVENADAGKLNESDYRPVYALGNACWSVITNKPFENSKEFLVGGVGYGNAAHLTSLALAEKYGFAVRYIIFKSNYDALINMAGDNGIELVIDRYEGYENIKKQNPKLKMVAASCPTRLPQAPEIPTLSELGINAPFIFNIIVAHKNMPEDRTKEIGKILDAATIKIGADEIYKISSMRPPVFDRILVDDFYKTSISLIRNMQAKYRTQIEESKK